MCLTVLNCLVNDLDSSLEGDSVAEAIRPRDLFLLLSNLSFESLSRYLSLIAILAF